MKKILVIVLLILISLNCFAESIDSVEITSSVRLGEKIAVRGQYRDVDSNAFELCKFEVKEAVDGNYIERWSDEYTFRDGTFYAERPAVEPPYYRGDDFNVLVTCGQATTEQTFTILQPVSLSHPVQKGWEWFFTESNQESIMMLVSVIAIIILAIFIFVFLVRRGGAYSR